MSSEKDISVKAYLTSLDGKEEVRRFFIVGDSQFVSLRVKIQTIFNLGAQLFKVQWKDSEEDFITISSDEELRQAIKESCLDGNDAFLRLYISVEKDVKDSSKGNEVHYGVVCDGCNGEVAGMRFKCVNCLDYDLCQQCKDKNIHNHHEFSRINPPSTAGESFKYGKSPKGEGRCPFSGGRKSSWNGARGSRNGPRHPFVGRNVSAGSTFSCPPPPHLFHCDFPSPSSGGFSCGVSNSFPNVEKMAEEASRFASEHATKHVADIMKGIWTAWSGQQHQESGNSTSGQQEGATAGIPIPDINIGITVDENGVRKNYSFGTNQGKDNHEAEAETEGEKEKKSERSSESINKNENPTFMDVDDSLPQAPRTTHPQSKGAHQAQKNSPTPTPPSDDWTLLNQDGSPFTSKPEDVTANVDKLSLTEPEDVTVNVDKSSSTKPHPNEKVRVALAHMKAMGYSDEGGWLSTLIEMKDGDLNQVLDLLLVSRK